MSITVNPDWWKTLFDDVYLKTDARSVCDEGLSRREADVIWDLLSIRPEHKILDLCGGQGRHSMQLSQRGVMECTVVDFSPRLLRLGLKTAQQRGHRVKFVQADARDTGLLGSSFDHVIIMGNSLGYLPEPDDDGRILNEAFRLLKPGSGLLVDVTDGMKTRDEMIPNAWHSVDDDLVVCRQRELDDGSVRVREMVLSLRKGLVRDQSYAIRLFTPQQLENLILRSGFTDVRLHRNFHPHERQGDYGFMNRRLLATARRPENKGSSA